MIDLTQVSRLVKHALEFYHEAHPGLTPAEKAEAMRDFRRFYLHGLRFGLRGIRWNFSGCIACPQTPHAPRPLRRVLLIYPEIVLATEGRALGTHVCATHCPAMDSEEGRRDVILPGALKRVAEEPPRKRSAGVAG